MSLEECYITKLKQIYDILLMESSGISAEWPDMHSVLQRRRLISGTEEAALGEGGGDLMANLGIPFVYKEGFGGGNHCVNLNS